MVKNQANGYNAISSKDEVLTWQECHAIAMIDAKRVSTDCNKYAKANVFQYYVCSNTWLILIRVELGDRAAYSVTNSIRREGFLPIIGKASDLANELITYAQSGKTPTIPFGWFMPEIKDMDLRVALQTLRYPKRFTPNAADVLLADTLKKFRAINRWDKETNWNNIPEWICSRMRPHLEAMLKYVDSEYENCIPHFSAGSTTVGRTVEAKLSEYSRTCKYWCDPMYPIGDPLDCVKSLNKDFWYTPAVKGVPKNYKTYRIIAPEHPYFAAEKQRIKDAVRRSIKRTWYTGLYDPECQQTNQDMARAGSIDGRYATIDLSSASDTVAETLAYYLLPTNYTKLTYKFRSTYMSINGDWVVKRMFATSGDPLCFDTEAMIFLSLALACGEIVGTYTGIDYLLPAVYGDDIIIDTRLFETMLDLLRILRFIPNDEKSFGTGGYRESCGVEYYYGYDVSTIYWPRSVMYDPRTTVQSLESLTALQRRTFQWWPISKFLTDVAMKVYPNMTSSVPGSESSDLWADAPWYITRRAPMDEKAIPLIGKTIDPEWTVREAHLTFTNRCKQPTRDARKLDLEMYHYVNFLHDGPVYATALDELLGVSEPTSRATDLGIPETVASVSSLR